MTPEDIDLEKLINHLSSILKSEKAKEKSRVAAAKKAKIRENRINTVIKENLKYLNQTPGNKPGICFN